MQDLIRVGIIGTGKHGSRYAGHIVNDLGERFRLTAISRRSAAAREQAKAWQAKLYPDWRDLVAASDVDAVIAVTTPNLNFQIGAFCVKLKKPLLIEKPLATDYSQANQMVKAFDRNGVPLTVAQTLRYNSVILALKSRLPAMGRLYSVAASQRLEPSTLPWLERPEIAGGGIIFHTAVHLFDALRFITGQEVKRIRAVTRNIFNPRLEDLLTAELEFEGGALGVVDASKVSPSRAGGYEFICAKGQLRGDQIHGTLQRIEQVKLENLQVTPPGPTLLPLLEDWHAFLRNTGPNPVPGKEGLAAVRLCHGCRESAATGRWVAVADL